MGGGGGRQPCLGGAQLREKSPCSSLPPPPFFILKFPLGYIGSVKRYECDCCGLYCVEEQLLSYLY